MELYSIIQMMLLDFGILMEKFLPCRIRIDYYIQECITGLETSLENGILEVLIYL